MKFPLEKFHRQFIDLFPTQDSELKTKMVDALSKLEGIPDSFCGAAWLTSQEFSYISRQIESILGYPYSNYFNKGVLFFYSTIPSENIEAIKNQTQKHYQIMNARTFNITSMNVFKTDGAARISNGKKIPILQYTTLLDCCPDDKSFFMVSHWHQPNKKDKLKVASIQQALIEIKMVYKQLYPNRFKPTDVPIITTREKEILILLSKGCSSKEVSEQLQISFHTVETHRKKLLQKWKVINTAQLIKEVIKRVNL